MVLSDEFPMTVPQYKYLVLERHCRPDCSASLLVIRTSKHRFQYARPGIREYLRRPFHDNPNVDACYRIIRVLSQGKISLKCGVYIIKSIYTCSYELGNRTARSDTNLQKPENRVPEGRLVSLVVMKFTVGFTLCALLSSAAALVTSPVADVIQASCTLTAAGAGKDDAPAFLAAVQACSTTVIPTGTALNISTRLNMTGLANKVIVSEI
jgi:hypothetical protein